MRSSPLPTGPVLLVVGHPGQDLRVRTHDVRRLVVDAAVLLDAAGRHADVVRHDRHIRPIAARARRQQP